MKFSSYKLTQFDQKKFSLGFIALKSFNDLNFFDDTTVTGSSLPKFLLPSISRSKKVVIVCEQF
jgi:hypothetical protein